MLYLLPPYYFYQEALRFCIGLYIFISTMSLSLVDVDGAIELQIFIFFCVCER